MYLFFI